MRTSFAKWGIVSVLLCGRVEAQEDVWAPFRFFEFFKLAPPGGEFEVYTETRFTRVQ